MRKHWEMHFALDPAIIIICLRTEQMLRTIQAEVFLLLLNLAHSLECDVEGVVAIGGRAKKKLGKAA